MFVLYSSRSNAYIFCTRTYTLKHSILQFECGRWAISMKFHLSSFQSHLYILPLNFPFFFHWLINRLKLIDRKLNACASAFCLVKCHRSNFTLCILLERHISKRMLQLYFFNEKLGNKTKIDHK